MAPVQSRFVAAGLAAGLVASTTFVAPSAPRAESQLRGGAAAPSPGRAVSAQKSGDGLAALAVLGAGLAALRGNSRVQARATSAAEVPVPTVFQPSEQFGATEPLGFFDPLGWRENPEKEPGNYGDPFGVNMYNEDMRMKELNNGRMAMISVLGIFAAEMATGKDAMQQFGLPAVGGARVSASSGSSFAGSTSSRVMAQKHVVRRAEAVIQEDAPPLFQPSEQFGATEPLGFFDPLGFTTVGDEKGFRKLRVSEIKHGRVAMMASIGLVGQHFLKFPFFEKAPAGFSIMDKGEGVLGFFAIFCACAPLELWWRENPEKEPGNYGDPFGVNMYNEDMRMKELNNGRMAMISVLGIFAAEMATGKDAMQQFGF